jgi:ABC-2 type transport system ATP-binding protein
MTPPLETRGLSKHARRGWALKDLTLTIPEGAVVGLAGPNSAGKSTLLELAVGLLAPTEGQIKVLGGDPRRDAGILSRVGYVPHDGALYRSFTVDGTMRFARETNPAWDEAFAVDLLAGLEPARRVSALSAGERARLALAVALGKRPALLLLDEPFARLDPLAAREFLQMLMDGVAATGATAVIASHVVADIERVADHIVLLSDGRVRLEGRVEDLLASHRLLTGARRPLGRIAGVSEVVRQRHSGRQQTLLARIDGRIVEPSWSVDEIGLEELLLAYMAPERLPQRPAAEQGRLRWHG